MGVLKVGLSPMPDAEGLLLGGRVDVELAHAVRAQANAGVAVHWAVLAGLRDDVQTR